VHGAYLAVGTADNEARSPKDVQLFGWGCEGWRPWPLQNLEHFSPRDPITLSDDDWGV